MHVAASNPQAVDFAGLPPELVRREREVLADKFKAQGKPAHIIDKIVEFGSQDVLHRGLPPRSGLYPRAGQERCPSHQTSRGRCGGAD